MPLGWSTPSVSLLSMSRVVGDKVSFAAPQQERGCCRREIFKGLTTRTDASLGGVDAHAARKVYVRAA